MYEKGRKVKYREKNIEKIHRQKVSKYQKIKWYLQRKRYRTMRRQYFHFV